jgi:hypothetical protein
MRIVTTILSIFLATATLGGCMARAKVRVADADKASQSEASKVAADDAQPKSTTVKADGHGGTEAPALDETNKEAAETAPAAR